ALASTLKAGSAALTLVVVSESNAVSAATKAPKRFISTFLSFGRRLMPKPFGKLNSPRVARHNAGSGLENQNFAAICRRASRPVPDARARTFDGQAWLRPRRSSR